MREEDKFFLLPKAQIYTKEYVIKRTRWLNNYTGTNLYHIIRFIDNCENFKGYIENLIGTIQIPLGIAGPLKINGQYAKGLFYVPLATTQSTLVRSYDRGMVILTKSGGVNTLVLKDEIHISPVFFMNNITQAKMFTLWIVKNFEKIKKEAEKTTSYGKLLRIRPWIIGKKVFLSFYYSTGDAMGLNIIVIATDRACRYISEKTKTKFYLRSNLSSDKKASFFNFIDGYGKEVLAEATIPKEIITQYLNTTPQEIYNFWHSAVLGSIQSGMIGINAHFANGLAAIFAACGQDVASIANAHLGIGECDVTEKGDLYITLKVPCLPIGTVGGATSLPAQSECLKIIGCFGAGKANKFAEIIGATLLGGEVSIIAALAGGYFAKAHIDARKRKLNEI